MKNTETEIKTQNNEVEPEVNTQVESQMEQAEPQAEPSETKPERTAEQAAQRMIASRFRKNHLAKVVDLIDVMMDSDEKPRFSMKPNFIKQQLVDSVAWVGKVGEVVNTKIPAFAFLKLAFKVASPVVSQDSNINLKFYPATSKYAFEGETPRKFEPEKFDRDLAYKLATCTNCYDDSTAIQLKMW